MSIVALLVVEVITTTSDTEPVLFVWSMSMLFVLPVMSAVIEWSEFPVCVVSMSFESPSTSQLLIQPTTSHFALRLFEFPAITMS